MHLNRISHTASLLPSGKVLVTGGIDDNYIPFNSTELYDPTTRNSINAGKLPLIIEDPL
jgi:hypothetical protein